MGSFSPNSFRLEYKGLSVNPQVAQLPCHWSSPCRETTISSGLSPALSTTHELPSCKLNHFIFEAQTCSAQGTPRSPSGFFPFFNSFSYTVLFEKLDLHIKCLEAFLCPRISYFLQSLTTCLYTGNTSRKFTKQDCLHPLDEFQVSFSS